MKKIIKRFDLEKFLALVSILGFTAIVVQATHLK